MPKIGTLPSSSRAAAIPYTVADGLPGPFDRKTPSKPPRATVAGGVSAGYTVHPIPWSARSRRIVRFNPKSYAATRKTRPRSADGWPATISDPYGSGVDTVFARSAPAIPAEDRIRSSRDPASRSSDEIAARIEPCSLIRRVSLRVSIPSIPATPAASGDRASSRRLPVRHHERSLEDRVGHPTAQPPAEERAVAGLRRERSFDDPSLVRIEDREVRRSAGFDRAAVIARAQDPRGGGRERVERARQREEARMHELRQDHPERRLEPDRSRRCPVELRLLLFDRMRSVVGGDRIDRAVGESRPKGVTVLRRPE